jgi:hypothetical protein
MAAKKVKNELIPDSLLVVLTANVGFRKAMKVLVFIVAWGKVYDALGHAPVSVEEYAYWWRESVPTAYREQKLFREALPGQTTPTLIWERVREQVDAADDIAPAVIGSLSPSFLGITGL